MWTSGLHDDPRCACHTDWEGELQLGHQAAAGDGAAGAGLAATAAAAAVAAIWVHLALELTYCVVLSSWDDDCLCFCTCSCFCFCSCFYSCCYSCALAACCPCCGSARRSDAAYCQACYETVD